LNKKEKETAFTTGGILAVLGLYLIFFPHDLQGGFVLLGIGVVIMASISEEFRKKVFDLFYSIFEGLTKILSRS